MTEGCRSLTSLDISNMNTRNLERAYAGLMFDGCTALTSIALGPDTILDSDAPSKGWTRTKLLTGEAANGPAITNLSEYSGNSPGLYTHTASAQGSRQGHIQGRSQDRNREDQSEVREP